jgi:hypothetical protein
MKLYVCYGTFKPAPRPGGHPCGRAYHALEDAGYQPEVKRVYGTFGALPGMFNFTPGRREVKRLTGNYWVPVLVTDNGEVVQESRKIEAWAKDHPVSAVDASADAPAPVPDAPAPTEAPADASAPTDVETRPADPPAAAQ